MTVEQAVRTKLVADAGVVAIASTRGYVQKFPQSPTYPAFRVTLVTEQATTHMRGATATKPALVQVDAATQENSGYDPYAVANNLADAIEAALLGAAPFVVSDGASPASQLELKVVDRPTRFPLYDPEELRVVRIVQEYRIWSRPV